MEEKEKEAVLQLLVQAVVRANHILMACEMAKDEDQVNAIAMPIPQLQTMAQTLGKVAMAFTKTGLFTQEQIERHVVEQTRAHDAMNFTMQLISQGADDEVLEMMLASMGYDADHTLQLITEAKKLFKHIQEEHPEMLPFQFEHPFKQFMSSTTAPSTDTKH